MKDKEPRTDTNIEGGKKRWSLIFLIYYFVLGIPCEGIFSPQKQRL